MKTIKDKIKKYWDNRKSKELIDYYDIIDYSVNETLKDILKLVKKIMVKKYGHEMMFDEIKQEIQGEQEKG